MGRSAGCGKTSTLTFGAVPGESGQKRWLSVTAVTSRLATAASRSGCRTTTTTDNPYWLVFGFHWNGGNSKEVDTGGSNGYNMSHFGLQKLSNNGAIFVAPDGLGAGWATEANLEFVDDMVELIQTTTASTPRASSPTASATAAA